MMSISSKSCLKNVNFAKGLQKKKSEFPQTTVEKIISLKDCEKKHKFYEWIVEKNENFVKGSCEKWVLCIRI